jgi:hypothetical protein
VSGHVRTCLLRLPDLRLDNVMETRQSAAQNAADELSLAMIGDVSSRYGAAIAVLALLQMALSCGFYGVAMHDLHRNYERQFKIIDYGLAKFDDYYSAAHGWLDEHTGQGKPHAVGPAAVLGALTGWPFLGHAWIACSAPLHIAFCNSVLQGRSRCHVGTPSLCLFPRLLQSPPKTCP